MRQYQKKTPVTKVERLAADMVRLTLLAPEIASIARPGQFVMIRTGSSNDPLLRRPFSLHQTDRGGHIQIYFRIVGRGTDLLSRVRVGEEVDVFGPLGHGFEIKGEGMACLVGGGIGIAPMLFLAKELSRQGSFSGVDAIILGGRSKSDILPVLNDFKVLGITVMTTTDDGSHGLHGRVTDAMQVLDLPEKVTVYACGPEPMLAAVSGFCQDRGLPCQVSVESAMACGMGACLGCNRPRRDGGYVHVCVDGPVFAAEELLWNS